MFCLYTLPLARPAHAKIQMLTTSIRIVTIIFKYLLNSLGLYYQKTNILFLIQYKDVIFSCFYFSSSSGNLDHVNSILNSDTNGFASFKTSGITLANLLSNSDNVNGFGDIGSSRNVAWSNGTDSHDSGIGHSPPFDNGLRYVHLMFLIFPRFFARF